MLSVLYCTNSHKTFLGRLSVQYAGGMGTGDDEDEDEDGDYLKGTNQGVKMGPDICLLTTKACGQGITLTGKNASCVLCCVVL